MAINGLETGAFGQTGLSGNPIIIPSAFDESPKHARDSGPGVAIGGIWNFIQDITDLDIPFDYPDQGGIWWEDGNHVLLFNPTPDTGRLTKIGGGYVGMKYYDLFPNGSSPPNDPSVIYGYLAELGSDTSFSAITSSIMPAGIYNCTFGFYMAQSFYPNSDNFVLPATASCQIISADFSQIIDITPPNTGSTAQPGVGFQLNSTQKLGRKTGFWPQISMTSIGQIPQSSYPEGVNSLIVFGPSFTGGPA